ncbi:hypothetical protein Ddye_020027 [Dipteronia dyeriana]|uniref:RNase H type-1 domain-containing protein n=1 Tax=Dipteronia dyeriana TaxID=168575 RepID=A0AAD9TZG4_9ROSI|nr:hypothetical protein Ddye_020027 [Dipteronia dyeriana]
MCWDWENKSHWSSFVKAVQKLNEKGSRTSTILEQGLRVGSGCGDRVKFWQDVWCNSTSLKTVFPRIYVLAINKDSMVVQTSWRSSNDSVKSMLVNIKDVYIDTNHRKTVSQETWQPPAKGTLKFNVDGSAKGCPGMAGMSVVLQNHVGRVLSLFSLHLGCQDSNSAEIMAVHMACEIDSMVATSWVNGVGFCNLKHVRTIYDVRTMINCHGNLKIIHNPRATNFFLDMLAKRGSNNEGDMLFVGE